MKNYMDFGTGWEVEGKGQEKKKEELYMFTMWYIYVWGGGLYNDKEKGEINGGSKC